MAVYLYQRHVSLVGEDIQFSTVTGKQPYCLYRLRIEYRAASVRVSEVRIRAMFQQKSSHIDIVINNAGIFDMLVPAGEVTDALWDKVIATNLTAPMRVIRKVLPVFEKQNGGVIVNTASIAGQTGARGGGAAYVASKYGLIGLTKNVAFNYKDKNIRCNAVAPGRVKTAIRANSEKLAGAQTLHDATVSRWHDIEAAVAAGYVTNQRFAQPEEIARAVLFLASDDASFVNGAVLTVDGAWTAY